MAIKLPKFKYFSEKIKMWRAEKLMYQYANFYKGADSTFHQILVQVPIPFHSQKVVNVWKIML